MPQMPPSMDRWVVSTQTPGEVLTTGAGVAGLEILLLGLPDGFSRPEVQGWIESLAAAAREGAAAASPDDPTPPALRHALGGLLFSHGELWAGSRPGPCSIVLCQEPGRIAFGWVGEAAVEIYEDGGRVAPEWVSVRDHHGREARGWAGDGRHDVRVELVRETGAEGEAGLARMEAHWTLAVGEPGGEAASVSPVRLTTEVGSQAVALPQTEQLPGAGASAAAPAEGAQPSMGVARWLSQHLEARRSDAEPGAAIDLPAAVPDQIPPTPEPAELTAAARLAGAEVQDPGAGPPPPESIPSAQAPDVPEAAAAAEAKPQPLAVAPPAEEAPGATAHPSAVSEAVADDEPLDAESMAPGETIPDDVFEPVPAAERGSQGPPAAETPARRGPKAQPAAWHLPSLGTEPPVPWLRWAMWTVFVLVLFGAGWTMGSFQGGSDQKLSPLTALLRGIGISGAHFQSLVTSHPGGARISIDGKDTGLRTPATIELSPGEHRVGLTLPGLGGASFTVRGEKGAKVPLDAPLWGSLDVSSSDAETPVSVAVDGDPRGFAPVRLEDLMPGPHELRFTGPGMVSWGTMVEVRVGENREVLAYPLQSPATGLLQVRATLSGDGGSQPLKGARVWVDGESRGTTPLTLELPRGPHSVRVARAQEETPIQVIDLPGGNQRFATFEFGVDADLPRLTLRAPPRFRLDEPALISATLTEVPAGDVREMWLHVRGPDNLWQRYPMTLLGSQNAVGAAPFPVAMLGSDGETRYYVSALTSQGDEIFTEMQYARAR